MIQELTSGAAVCLWNCKAFCFNIFYLINLKYANLWFLLNFWEFLYSLNETDAVLSALDTPRD